MFQFSSQQTSRFEAELCSGAVDFHLAAVCDFVNETQKTGLVVFQTGIVKVVRSDVPDQEGFVRQETHHDPLPELHGAVVEPECLVRAAAAHFVFILLRVFVLFGSVFLHCSVIRFPLLFCLNFNLPLVLFRPQCCCFNLLNYVWMVE